MSRAGDRKGPDLGRLMRFGLSGVAGFVVDAAVLSAGIWAGMPAWAARVPSFLAAVVATWAINRRLTFKTRAGPSLREFGTYLAAMSLGLAINYVTYLGGLALGLHPILALAAGTGVAMVANYLNARRILDG